MKNRYEIRGDLVVIYLNRKNSDVIIEAYIDVDDLKRANEFDGTWYAHENKSNGKFYVWGNFPLPERGRDKTGRIKRGTIHLHRWLTNPPDDLQVDHLDGEPLNNRRSNLEIKSNDKNAQNRHGHKNNKSGYRGVCWVEEKQKWSAYATVYYKSYFLGYYDDVEEANRAASKFRSAFMEHSEEGRNKDVKKDDFNIHRFLNDRRKVKTSRSVYRGVYYNPKNKNKCWTVQVRMPNGKQKVFQSYEREEDAAMVHDMIVRRLYGVNGRYNFPEIFHPEWQLFIQKSKEAM